MAVVSFYIARTSKREAAQANARADTASGEATEANERADAATARAAAAQEADIETRAFLTRASRLAKSLESKVAAVAATTSEPPFRRSPLDRPRANYFMSDSGQDSYAKLLEDL